MKEVLILFGGNSFEHEISCKSVNYVIKNIDIKKFKYKLVGIDFNNDWFEINNIDTIDKNWKNKNIKQVNNIISYIKKFDIVFPVIHGNYGEDGKLQALFEIANNKYVGCNSYSNIICYDKLLTKLILEKYDIPQVKYYIYNDKLNIDNIKYPVIIKPCKCGSSIGINIADDKKELKKALKEALKYDSNIIIEEYIKNKRELECAVIEKKNKIITSDIGEIKNNDSWYDFDSKYINSIDTMISDIDNIIKNEITMYSKKIFKILNCKDLSRIDFLYDKDNKKLYFNEINTMPGLTEISMFPKLLNNLGLDNKEIINTLLDT